MKLFSRFFLFFTCLILYLTTITQVSITYAVPVCGENFTCNDIIETCLLPGGDTCLPGEPGCICNSSCGPGTDGPWACLPNNTCPDPSTLCSELCGMPPGGYACVLTPDACTVDSQCGVCGACCAGSPNTCRTDGKTCGGVDIPGCGAAPTATPTPTPAPIPCTGTCGNSSFSGACSPPSGGNWIWDGNPSASTTCQTNPNTYCYNCIAGPPPTPTPVGPTPTPGGTCPDSVCNGSETCSSCAADCGACPFCGDSVCNGSETNATCPSDCPPVVVPQISGQVYNDLNGNGVKNAGESGINRATVLMTCNSCTDTQTILTNSSGNFTFSPLYNGPTYTLRVTDGGTTLGINFISNPATRSTVAGGTNQNFGLWAGNTIALTVFIDINENGIKDVTEVGKSGVSTYISTGNCADGINNDGSGGTDSADTRCHVGNVLSGQYRPDYDETSGVPTDGANGTTSAAGLFTGLALINGSYQVYATLPAGYTATSPNPLSPRHSITGGVTNSVSIGILPASAVCVGGLIAVPTTLSPGATATLSVTTCSGNENPDNGVNPPPFEWKPAVGPPNPACNDGLDNDSDGLVDIQDPGCHDDGNTGTPPTFNPTTYDNTDDNERQNGSPNQQCSDNLDNDSDGAIDALDNECHTDGDADDDNDGIPDVTDTDDDGDGILDISDPGWKNTYKPNDDSESSPSTSCPDGQIGVSTNTATSSTNQWTAPSCPASPLSCQVGVNISNNIPGGPVANYITTINVSGTHTVTANIRTVLSAGSCTSSSGVAYTDTPINVNLDGRVQVSTTGSTTFACVESGDYVIQINTPSGYAVVDVGGGTQFGQNGISFTADAANPSPNPVFCIVPSNSWFQTDIGDARFLNLTNLVPLGEYGSTGLILQNNPGIFYSSKSNANFGSGLASIKNWVINKEYDYNSDTDNRNGGMSYEFYKSKAKKNGVEIKEVTGGIINLSDQIFSENGVYEVDGSITSFSNATTITGKRIVLLVSGDVNIDQSIKVTPGNGLFILAAKGDITIAQSVGITTLASTTTQLDGYYSAHKDIVIDGNGCPNGIDPDKKLNVGGAFIANSLKPFASEGGVGTGVIRNRRSLCAQNLTYPSFYISSRPDFLVQLTDFYKTTYTKWKEERP